MPRSDPASAELESSDSVRTVGALELFLTVFVTGAAIMTIEIVGTRIIGPVFGVGLFVWSALLAVTLAALASGYYAGGVLAARRLTSTTLGSVVTTAGALLAVAPLAGHGVLNLAEGWGPRAGPLFGAALIFAPALMALGMTGPLAMKLWTKRLSEAGRGLGSVYAVSTAGSLVGTLVVGFVAIPAFAANSILACASGVLVLLGACSLAFRKRPLALGLLIGPLVLLGGTDRPLPAGFKLLDKSQSLLGLVEVIDDEKRGVRFLRSDHSILGATYLRDGSPGFSFVNVLKAISFCRPHAKRMLNIGLGSGAVPSALGRLGIQVDVVEIDAAVVRFAQKYFGFSATGSVYTEDARTFLRRPELSYDLVVHDTFTGGATPEHLLSLEVLQRLHGVLRPDGVLALNFVGYYEGSAAEASFAVARTLRAVFRHVHAFRDSAPDASEPVGNILFFASDGPIDFNIPAAQPFENANEERTQRSFTAWKVLERVPEGPLITDAQNPLGRLQLPIAEKHFAAMNELLPTEVWLD